MFKRRQRKQLVIALASVEAAFADGTEALRRCQDAYRLHAQLHQQRRV